MQAYYEGYVAGGCIKEVKNGITLKQFALVDNNIKTYQCERACQGCRSDNDCKLAALITQMRNVLLGHAQVAIHVASCSKEHHLYLYQCDEYGWPVC